MFRALFLLVLGAAGGAALTYHLVARDAAPTAAIEPAAAPPAGAAAPARRTATAPTADAAATAERAETYRVAAEADAAALARLIDDAARQPASATREFTLGVLLTRYAELDAEGAVEIADRAGANAELRAALYAQWAGTDPAGALASLSGVEDPALATHIGLALLPVLGGDDYAVRQVLAALPLPAERDFRVTAIADLARSAPAAAFEQALDLDEPGARSLALERMAGVWARGDARAALERADEIDDDELRTTFQNGVLREWARFDTDGLFDYIAGLDPESQERLANTAGLMELARIDPLRAFELGTALPPRAGSGLQRTALFSLAQQDPVAALRYLDRVPNAQTGRMVRQMIGRAYGQQHPDAALDWARASGAPEDLAAVLGGIAQKDATRALDIALSLVTPQQRSNAVQSIVNGLANDRDADFTGIANRLLALEGDPARDTGLLMTAQMWVTREPDRALDWLMANASRATMPVFQSMARSLGANNPLAATQYFAQVPTEMRAAWLQGTAQGYAQSDPRAAAEWIGQHRGQPGYANGAAMVAQGLAGIDAPAAAQLLNSLDAKPEDAPQIAMAANNVAARWAQSNPLAAAEWAVDLPSGPARGNAIAATAGVWANSDYAGARGWTMRLASGETRDMALNALLNVRSATESPDATLIGAFSSEPARQQAVLGALRSAARRDPAEARALIDRYLSSPAQRQQAEQIMEQARLGTLPQRFPGNIPILLN